MPGMFDDLVPQQPPAPPAAQGGGMFDDLVPAAAPKQQVGALDSYARGTVGALHRAAGAVNLVAGMPIAGAVDMIHDALQGHNPLNGPNHGAQDFVASRMVDPQYRAAQQEDINPETEQQGFGAKVAGGVGAMLPDFLGMLATGGEAPAASRLVEPVVERSIARAVGEHALDAVGHSAKASLVPSVSHGTDQAHAAVDNGASVLEALGHLPRAYGEQVAQNTLPLAAGARQGAGVIEEALSKAAQGAVAGPAVQGTVDAIEGRPSDAQDLGVNAVLSALMAQMGGGGGHDTFRATEPVRAERDPNSPPAPGDDPRQHAPESGGGTNDALATVAPPRPTIDPAEVAARMRMSSQAAQAPRSEAPVAPAPVARPEARVQRPAAPAIERAPFQTPDEHTRADFAAKAAEHGIAPDVAEKLAPTAPVDRTTGFVDGRQGALDTTIERAQAHTEQTGEPAVYVSGDIANLGGLNKHFASKQADADVHYKAMADIMHDELRGTGGDVVPMRTGGDEVGAVVVNADKAAVDAALDRARARIADYAQANGLDTIPHKETGRAPGVGMHFGAAEIGPGVRVKDILDRADAGIDISRNDSQRASHVTAIPTETRGAGAPEGRPAGTAGSPEAPRGGIRPQDRAADAAKPAEAEVGAGKRSAKDYTAEITARQKEAQQLAKEAPRETITPANDKLVGENDDGVPVYERADGFRYRVRDGRVMTGGNLVTTAELAAERAERESPSRSTSTKNEVTDRERDAEGREPREHDAPQSNDATLERARADLASKPERGAEVVEKLKNAGVEGITVHDEAMLMAHKVDVRKRRDAAAERSTDASLTDEQRAVARREYDDLSAQVNEIDQAAYNGGREWGRLGQLRQRMLREDFSFEAMERKARIAHDRPLTPEELSTVKAQAKKIAQLQERLDQAEARAAFAEQSKSVVREGRAAAGKQRTRSDRLQRMEARANEARARLRAKLGVAHSGVDPGMFADAATIGAYHLMRGVEAAAVWAKAMRDDLGDKLFKAIEPRLDELRKAAEALVAKEGTSVGDILDGIDPENITGRDISKLVRANILRGKHAYDDVMAAVHEDLSSIADITPEQVRELYAEVRAQKPAPAGSPEAATVRRIAQTKEKTDAQDFDRKERGERSKSKVEERLAFELSQAKAEFARQQFEAEMARRPKWKKVFGGAAQAAGVARAYQTGLDVSAVFRQAGPITMQALVSPKKAVLTAKATVAMLRAMRSAEVEHAINAEIASRPNARLYKKYGLELTDAHHHSLSKMEEAFMSRWIDRLPKAVGGGLVRGSNRAYTTFLNKLRADSFDAMAATLGKTRELSKDEGEAIAGYINIATGRGNIGKHNRAAVGVNVVFFSPRFVASRFQFLAGTPLYGGSARTRRLIAGEYARFLAGAAVVYGLAAMATDEEKGDGIVTFDPRSTDFGRIKIGNTYIDPLAGLSQNTVLLTRIATGKKVSVNGKLSSLREGSDEKPAFGADNTFDILARFLRTKLAPVPGAAVNIATGSDVVGNPVTVGGEAFKLVQPMSLQNIGDIMQENGVPQGATIEMLNLLGMSVQYREPREKKPDHHRSDRSH